MAPRPGYDRARLEELSRIQGIPAPPRLTRLRQLSESDVPEFVTPVHEQRAEQCLLEGKSSKLFRKPTLRTKARLESYEVKNITAALPTLIASQEGAGVIQALLNREHSISSVKDDNKRQSQMEDRDTLLQKAVDASNTDLIWLLAPRTSLRRRNEALALALQMRNSAAIKKLLEYNADPNHCSRQFVAAAASGDHFVVEHLLSSPLDLQQEVLIEALVPAVQANSLRTLQLIVCNANLRGLQEIDAVDRAAHMGHIDALLTILLSTSDIRPTYLGQLVLDVFNNDEIDTASLVTIIRALFFAGAVGPQCSAAMRLAVEQQSVDFIQLFAENKVDVNWGTGRIVKSAVQTGRCDLLHMVLLSGALSKENASAVVDALPRNLPAQVRFEMLETLMRAGAYGDPIEKELILAVQNNDQNLVALLRQGGVSIDNRQGDALIAAIQSENVKLLAHLLDGPVSQTSLQAALPCTRATSKMSRLLLTKLLVKAKVEGEAVDIALRDSVCDESLNRDEDLIDVLIQAGGDPAYDNAVGLRYAIRHEDTELFEKLLTCPAGVSEGIVTSLIPEVVAVSNRDARMRMMVCALATRPREHSVTTALLQVVSEKDIDAALLKLIARSDQADINHQDGIVLVKGSLHPHMLVLEELMGISNRSRSTTTNALVKLLEQRNWTDDIKAPRATILMSSGTTTRPATHGLVSYVKFWKASGTHGRHWPMRTFEILLGAGADINSSPSVLLDATKAAAKPLLSALVTRKPLSTTVDKALREALKLNSDDRDDVLRLLIEAGPSRDGLSLALVRASRNNLDDSCSLLLANGADLEYDNSAAIRHAVTSGRLDLFDVFLRSKPAQGVIEAAFQEVKNIVGTGQRCQFLDRLLQAGVPQDLQSGYLIDVAGSEGQEEVVQLLLNYQADVHHEQNRSLVLAAIENRLRTLQILFTKATNRSISATQCFESCVESNKVRQDHISTLQFLLETGANGHSLNVALQQTVFAINSQPSLILLLQLLISHGADTNDDSGHALCHACETTSVEVVSTIIRGRPSVVVRSRAMHFLLKSTASELEFCQILDLLMHAEMSFSSPPSFSLVQNGFENPLQVLLSSRPNGAIELAHLLKYQGQIVHQLENDNILAWAMAQNGARIDDQCLAMLVNHGANVRYQDNQSGETVLLQAIRDGRSQLIGLLLANGADGSIADTNGTTPLRLASVVGDQLAASSLLKMGAPKNDGSLHQAVRAANVGVVEVLLKNNHDPNHPSPQAQGRTPLAELLYAGDATLQNYNAVKRVVHLLRDHGADTKKRISRKPLICWALDNKRDPLRMVEVLLSAYLHKEIDEDFNLYTKDGFCYSPTMYVEKRQFAGVEAEADKLVTLLRNWGANRDVYYSLMGPQPEDAQGMPEDLAKLEALRRAKIAMRREEDEELARRRKLEDEEFQRRLQKEDEENERRKRRDEEDFQRQISYNRELATEDQRLLKQKHDLGIQLSGEAEAAKQREMVTRHRLQLSMQQELAEAEQQALLSRLGIQQSERQRELTHRTDLGKLELQTTRERLLLESENQKTMAAAAQSALEIQMKAQERLLLSQDKYSEKHHNRRMKQLAYEKAKPVGWTQGARGYIEEP